MNDDELIFKTLDLDGYEWGGLLKMAKRGLDFEPIDCGPLSMARYLEPLAMLWIKLAYSQGFGTDIAFRLLKREA